MPVKKMLLFLLILVGVGFGAAYGYFLSRRKRGAIPQNASFVDFLLGRVASASSSAGDAGDAGATRDASAGADEKDGGRTDKNADERGGVRRMRETAEAHYRAGRFTEAAEAAAELMRALETEGVSSGADREWATRLRKRSRVFARLMAKTTRSPLADGEGIHRIELDTGAVRYGRVLKKYERDGRKYVEYEGADAITAVVPADRVVEDRPVSPEEHRRFLKEALRERLDAMDRDDYFQLYAHGVVFARSCGLDDELAGLLEEVFRRPGSEALVWRLLCNESDVKELHEDLLVGMGRKPLHVEGSDEGRAGADRSDGDSAGAAAGVADGAPAGLSAEEKKRFAKVVALYEKAETLASEAVRLLGKARRERGNRALGLLQEAQRLLLDLRGAHQQDRTLYELERRVGGLIYFVQKTLTGLEK